MKLNEKMINETVNKIVKEHLSQYHAENCAMKDRLILLQSQQERKEKEAKVESSRHTLLTSNDLVITEGNTYTYKEKNGTQYFRFIKSIESDLNNWVITVISSKALHSNDLVHETVLDIDRNLAHTENSSLSSFVKKSSETEAKRLEILISINEKKKLFDKTFYEEKVEY